MYFKKKGIRRQPQNSVQQHPWQNSVISSSALNSKCLLIQGPQRGVKAQTRFSGGLQDYAVENEFCFSCLGILFLFCSFCFSITEELVSGSVLEHQILCAREVVLSEP